MKLTVKLPNFSTTRGSIADVTGDGSPRGSLRGFGRKLKNYGLWILAGVFFFGLFAWLSIPTRAIAWRISHEAKARGYIVDIEDLSVTPFGGITLQNVAWTFEPSRPDAPPTKFFMEEVDIDVGVFALLGGDIDVEVENEREEGRIYGHYVKDAEVSRYVVKVEGLPLYDVPKAAQSLNAPLIGTFGLDAELELPEHKFAKATGTISLACTACRLGDGESKLYVPGSKSLKDGITIPEIDLGTLTGKMVVDAGAATIDGAIQTESDDIWIEITGGMKLMDPFAKSRFEMVLKVKFSEALQERSDKVKLMVQTASAKVKLEEPAGGMGYRMEGAVSAPRFLGINSKTARELKAERRAKLREREEKRRRQAEERRQKADAKKDAEPPTVDPGAFPGEPMPGEEDSAGQQPLNVQPLDPSAVPPMPDPGRADPPSPPPEQYPPQQPVEPSQGYEDGGAVAPPDEGQVDPGQPSDQGEPNDPGQVQPVDPPAETDGAVQ